MKLNEENARIVLLGCFIIFYVLMGAFIIGRFESPFEKQLLRNYWKIYEEFLQKLLNGTAEIEELNILLYSYSNVTSAIGVPGNREKWNFLGSLHFVVTIITTIGYGSYTPHTNEGKIFVIFYGFFGCASGILFFNLFLERLITFLAYFLRELYIKKVIRHEEDIDPDKLFTEWKPSVYSVMLCLILGSLTIGTIAVPTYSMIEGWSYIESAYFCFVSFATIGFGDFVAAQKHNHQYSTLYFFINIILVAIGCCFLYSLFNVISIVFKQILNWLIFRLNAIKFKCPILSRSRHSDYMFRKYSLKMQREKKQCHRRKPSITAARRRTLRRTSAQRNAARSAVRPAGSTFSEMNADDADRKLSDDGLISMKDFLTTNQVSLAVMQKQLQDSAEMNSINSTYNPTPVSIPADESVTVYSPVPRRQTVSTITTSVAATHHKNSIAAIAAIHHKNSIAARRFIPGTIGPLAILCDKLGDK